MLVYVVMCWTCTSFDFTSAGDVRFFPKKEKAPIQAQGTAQKSPFVYMHIAKTGGTTLSQAIPLVLGLGNFQTHSCNAVYKIPKYGLEEGVLNSSLSRVQWGSCSFLSYEWHRTTMERVLLPFLRKFRVLTSFREPLSHFFSACIHNAIMLRSSANETYNFASAVEALKEGKELRGYYSLHNFQTSYLVNSSKSKNSLKYEKSSHAQSIAEAREYLKQIYWFSLADHMSLSLSLLQCQVFGAVKPDLLATAARLPHLNEHSSSQVLLHVNSGMLADIHSLIKADVFMYELIVREFWKRVRYHKECILGYNSGKEELRIFLS